MRKLVERLINEKKKIATMESCTGGDVANEITNVSGASEIIGFSAITYSNDAKIMMGVSPKVIDKFSVYSRECADEMSFNIAKFADSNIGVGVTGKLNRSDINNPYGDDNVVFISVYDRDNNKYFNSKIEASLGGRVENKGLVIAKVIELVNECLDNK